MEDSNVLHILWSERRAQWTIARFRCSPLTNDRMIIDGRLRCTGKSSVSQPLPQLTWNLVPHSDVQTSEHSRFHTVRKSVNASAPQSFYPRNYHQNVWMHRLRWRSITNKRLMSDSTFSIPFYHITQIGTDAVCLIPVCTLCSFNGGERARDAVMAFDYSYPYRIPHLS